MDTPQISSNEIKYRHQNPLQRYFISRFLDTINELVISLGVMDIFDVGCGEGFLTNSLLDRNDHLNITGIEISLSSITNGKLNSPELKMVNGSAYELPFPTRSVNLVICTEVLEHLTSPEEVVAEIKRVTKQYCIFSVPNEPYFMLANFLRGKNIKRFGNDIEHIQHWGTNSFIKFLQKNGLSIEKTKNQFPWIIVLATIKNHE